jgi:peptidyl-prolyl cis-trans isomerase A (cyclophilin A)
MAERDRRNRSKPCARHSRPGSLAAMSPIALLLLGSLLITAGAVAAFSQSGATPPASSPAAVKGAATADASKAPVVLVAPEVLRARFDTSRGAFVVEMRRSWAPHGVDRFFELASAGFFDDSRFFRVNGGSIAQFGVAGDPAVSARWAGRTIADDPVRQANARGTLAFAMTGPGTRQTQIYINLADNLPLDDLGFAPIGRVVSGLTVVDRLYAGYGERSGGGMRGHQQGRLLAEGNAWLDAEFPKLDHLVSVRILAGTGP